MDANTISVTNIPVKNNPELVDNYFKSIISFSHLMGAITSIVVDYIKSAFDKDYIKTIWNTMEVPFVQRSQSFKDMMAKPRPILIIDPKFDPSDEPKFVPQSEFDEEIANSPLSDVKIGMARAQMLVGYNNFALFYKPRRYKMTYNLNFIFDSDIQRIQCQEFVRQSIRHKTPIQFNYYLENIIPESYMGMIADINGFNYTSDEFLDWIGKFTTNRITRRLRTGSGNQEFFVLLSSPIDMIFPDAPSSNGPLKRGNISISSSFGDVLEIEFVAASQYFLKTSTKTGEPIFKDNTKYVDEKYDYMSMVGTNKMLIGEIPVADEMLGGFIKHNTITAQPSKNGDDSISIMDVINDAEIARVLEYYQLNKLPVNFMRLLVFEDTQILDGSRCIFDSSTLELTIKNMNIYNVYYITIYVNRKMIAEVRDKIFGKTL